MKNKFLLIAIVLMSFAACKGDKKEEKPSDNDKETVDESNQSLIDEEDQDPPLNYCSGNVFKLNIIDDYDSNGNFKAYYNIPTGTVTVLGKTYNIETKVDDIIDISSSSKKIILETRSHGNPYTQSLCNRNTVKKEVIDRIGRIINGFDPSKKEDVYYFVLHDETYAARPQSQKDSIIAELRGRLDSIQAFDYNVKDVMIDILEDLKDDEILRPNTIGGGVIPPKN